MIHVATVAALFLSFAGTASGFKRVCYHTNWSQYRPGAGQFYPENIDPSLCSHIIYAFSKLNGNHLEPFEWNDDSTEWMKGMFERFNDLKKKEPSLKTLLAIGGWNMGSEPFTSMVNTESSRKDFALFAVSFLRERNFDGLDLDWEYPANRGSPAEDKDKFTLLVKEVRAVFEQDARETGEPRLLLTAAVAAGKGNIDTAYDVPEISKHLDFINLMTYDLHGSWESITGHNSPLYPRAEETGDDRYLNMDSAAKYWVELGCPSEKLVIGLAAYGRSFQLLSTSDTGVGSPTRGKGAAGRYTREPGFLAYHEICQMLLEGAETHYISEQEVPYIVKGDQWVGYDDPHSLQIKLNYILTHHYGGFMVWAIDLDDFNNQCGDGQYPLLNTLNRFMDTPTDSTQQMTTVDIYPNTNTTAGKTEGLSTVTKTVSGVPLTTEQTKPDAPVCKIGQDGYNPSATSCQEYIRCIGGVSHKFTCDPRLVFNPSKNVCDWPANYNCVIGHQGSGTNGSSKTTTVWSSTTASIGNLTTTTNTPSPTPTPTPPSSTQSLTTPANATQFETFCKTLSDGFYADIRDCHFFFHCTNRRTFRKKCGIGAAYSDNLPGCIYEEQVPACRTHK